MVASLGCALSTSPLMLNLSRALQGAGASLLLTCALAIINHSFQGAERARAYAFWGAALGIAITCGPIVGGVISSALGWQWAFLINLPICIALIAATVAVIPESSDPEATRFDYAGVATFSSGLFLLTWGVIDGNALGWTSTAVAWRLLGGLALLAGFVVVERMQARPMVDFAVLRSSHFVGTAFAMVGYAAGAQVMIFYLPLYLQNAYGYAPVDAGLAMLPFALPMFVVPRLAATWVAHWPTRSVLCLGLATTGFADLWMASLASSRASYGLFALAMVVAGTGAGLLNGDTAKAMQGAVPPQRSGMASGLSATVRFSALLLGVAALGAILIAVTGAHFAPLAAGWGLDDATGLAVAKRFSAGDLAGALATQPAAVRDAMATALRRSFDAGFAAATTGAAALAFVTMAFTRLLMTGRAANQQSASLVVPGE